MFRNHRRARTRTVASLLAVSVVTGIALTGCSAGGGAAPTPTPTHVASAADIEAALQVDTTLTMWGWAPQDADLVAAFEAKYPHIKVDLQNNGSNGTEYTKLLNVVKAGSGVPDVAQIEYTALPQFAFGNTLVNLDDYGLDSLKSKYSTSAWTEAHTQGGFYGLPQDDGPLAMFYRKDIFDSLGLKVPTTWDEYIKDAKIIHDADPTKFITTDAGDPALVEALIWQAGGHPFKVDGTNVSINLQDKGSKKFAEVQNQLVTKGLVDTIPTFSPEWTTAMGQGTYATWIAGAWGTGSLLKRFPQDAGKWQAALVPQYGDGKSASGVKGGSATAVMAASTNKLAAIGFAQWISSSSEAAQLFADKGGFPTASETLGSSDWLNKPIDFFGGEKANKVFIDSINGVSKDWDFLPYELYAGTVFADTMGQSYAKHTDLNAGLKAWQDSLVSYGNQQGFTVNK